MTQATDPSIHYKGFRFAAALGAFLPHMESVNDHRESLGLLGGSWDTLSLLGHLSSIRVDIGKTRESFDALAGRLLGRLADEGLRRVVSGLGYKAQFCIDVLVRNLFERTADIGFLATDSAVVAACAAGVPDGGALRERFSAYVQRYSVYQDVILLNADGRVLARLRDGFTGTTASKIVRQAADTAGYVERHGVEDLTGAACTLTYAAAVRTAAGQSGALLLAFDLAGEAELLFDKLRSGEEIIALVDGSGRVVLSSDAQVLPAGYRLPPVGEAKVVRIGGCQHVAVQRRAAPYQGYGGPGWTAVALLPVDAAFVHAAPRSPLRFSGDTVFSPELRAIPNEAAAIQHRLERVVWNGRLQQSRLDDAASGQFSRALLEEIAHTGRRTKSVFDTSITELLDTAAGKLLNEVHMLSALLVDIMDRNLFERACDCRWWSQDGVLQSLDAARATEVLRHINGLYTVYTDIVLFDAGGCVVASSAGALAPRSVLEGAWVRDCLAVSTPLGYAVSAFAADSLYGGRPTYVYAAPLRTDGRVVGGIGLVFDAEPQFHAMCAGALPQRAGAVSALVRTDGTPVSASGTLPCALSRELFALAPGRSWSGFVEEAGQCFAVAATAGSGYREFKTTDGYRETIIGVVVVPCGAVLADAAVPGERFQPVHGGQEVATFAIGEQWVGMLSRDVVECIDLGRSVRVSRSLSVSTRGYVPWRDGMLPLVDLAAQLGQAADADQAVVLRVGDRHVGLLASKLGPIVELEIAPLALKAPNAAGRVLMTQMARSGPSMVPLLSLASVAEQFQRAGDALPLPAADAVAAVMPAAAPATARPSAPKASRRAESIHR